MSREDAASPVPSPAPHQRPRTRDEIARERADQVAELERQIDEIAAEFHALLPRDKALAVGGVYARFSSRFQHSIADQVRALFEAAVKQGIYIPREYVFYDTATRGYKDNRPGLNGLRAALIAGVLGVLLVFSTNRLFRKTYKSLQFVEEEVVGRGIRCLFVKSGVDTADANRWRMLLNIHTMTDEFVVGMYADNIRASHEGLFEGGLVFGTITFGYRGGEVPGRPTKRGLARRLLEVDPEIAAWVLKAFTWFVEDRLRIDEIARRFNDDPGVPPSPKGLGGRWSHNSVRYLLQNARYRGWWEYGRTVNVWQVAKDYSRQVERPEPLREGQFEHLRIVSDELWHRAQGRLAEHPRPPRPEPRDGDRRSRPRLLNGLLFCPTHDRIFYAGGSNGKLMFCKDCQSTREEDRPLYSLLNRALALRMTCRALARLVSADEALVGSIIATCRDQADRAQRPDPARLEELRRTEAKLNGQIRFLLENNGETDEDRRETADRLRALRRERAEVSSALARAQDDEARPIVVPDEAEVRAMIADLAVLLESAASGAEEDSQAARETVELLTGGRIELEQMGERRRHGGWLRGRFRARPVGVLASRSAGVEVEGDDGIEVIIDYREQSDAEALADRVKGLYDKGDLIKNIARSLEISRNLATRVLAAWYTRRGQEVPDGRSRRKDLAKKTVEPPKYGQISDEAKRLWDEGLLMTAIQKEVNCDATTLTAAIKFWHESRGLPVPDGRTRRKSLATKVTRPRANRDRTEAPPAA
jgi:site-specific DNA recombinase